MKYPGGSYLIRYAGFRSQNTSEIPRLVVILFPITGNFIHCISFRIGRLFIIKMFGERGRNIIPNTKKCFFSTRTPILWVVRIEIGDFGGNRHTILDSNTFYFPYMYGK